MRLEFHENVAAQLRESNYRIIVTGAGGWLGLATLEMLESALGPEFDARVVSIASAPRSITLRSGKKHQLVDFAEAHKLSAQPTLLAHYAFLTRDKVSQNSLADYTAANKKITSSALALAQSAGAEGVFLTSSGAVYEADRTICRDVEKNPYGFLKAEEEKAFVELSQSYSLRLSLCRLFNLSGPFIHKEFALNSILLSILENKDVLIRARHKVIRDYIHVRDLVSLGFAMMIDEKNVDQEPFDSGIGSPIEIGELAERAIEIISPNKLKIIRENLVADRDIYIGDVTKISGLFKRYKISFANLDRQIVDTTGYLSSLA